MGWGRLYHERALECSGQLLWLRSNSSIIHGRFLLRGQWKLPCNYPKHVDSKTSSSFRWAARRYSLSDFAAALLTFNQDASPSSCCPRWESSSSCSIHIERRAQVCGACLGRRPRWRRGRAVFRLRGRPKVCEGPTQPSQSDVPWFRPPSRLVASAIVSANHMIFFAILSENGQASVVMSIWAECSCCGCPGVVQHETHDCDCVSLRTIVVRARVPLRST